MQVSMHPAEWDSYLKNGSWGAGRCLKVDIVHSYAIIIVLTLEKR
jgi:hypothetical protein